MSHVVFAAWGVSEEFLQKGYVKECISLLYSLVQNFSFQRTPHLAAKTHFRLAQILLKYTVNYEQAKDHLTKALLILNKDVAIVKDSNAEGLTEAQANDLRFGLHKFKAKAETLMNLPAYAKKTLQAGQQLAITTNHTFWRHYFTLELATIMIFTNNAQEAAELLSEGQTIAQTENDNKTMVLYQTVQTQMHLIRTNKQQAEESIQACSTMLQSILPNEEAKFKEYFFQEPSMLTIYLHHLIMQGFFYLKNDQETILKDVLNKLQTGMKIFSDIQKNKEIQKVTPQYEWIDGQAMMNIPFLLTAVFNRVSGATKVTDSITQNMVSKLDTQFEKYSKLMAYPLSSELNQNIQLLLAVRFFFTENKVLVNLTRGDLCNAIKDIDEARHILDNHRHMLKRFRFNIHLLIGLYSMMSGELNAASNQFKYMIGNCKEPSIAAYARLFMVSTKIMELKRNLKSDEKNPTLALFKELDQISAEESTSKMGISALISFLRGVLCTMNGALSDAESHFNTALQKSQQMNQARQIRAVTSIELGKLFESQSKEGAPQMYTSALSLSTQMLDLLHSCHAASSLNDSKATEYYEKLLSNTEKAKALKEHSLVNWYPTTEPGYQQALRELD